MVHDKAPIQRMRGSRGEQSGFTLVEILVTMTITIIGLTGLLSLHMATIKGNQIASRSAEATTFAQEVIEELRTRTVDSIIAQYGLLPVNDELIDSPAGRAGMTYTRRLWINELTTMSEDLIRIRVEVSWADDGADPATADESLRHSIALEIVRTRQEKL
jgi:prepilin-type N-terminal cleavage/methylation domain-containing protein